MTSTISRSAPAAGGPAGSSDSPGTAPPRTASRHDQLIVLVTATVAAGVLLTLLPLRSIFSDWTWFTISVVCSVPYVAVVALFRSRYEPRWWHSLVGLLATLLVLCWVFVPQHLILGVAPSTGSWNDFRLLIDEARELMRTQHTPLASTDSLRLLTAGATVFLVMLTDVLDVLVRRPLLASAPLLEVLAVASATSSKSARPVWFVAAAVGFLLILVAGTRLQDRDWGPSVDGSAGRLGGARRMAITGIVAALVIPLALPSVPRNLLSSLAHNGSGLGSGNGSGQITLNSSADLSGSLELSTPIDLLKVQVGKGQQPFYVRQAVLDRATETGWIPTSGRQAFIDQTPLSANSYPIIPESINHDGTSTSFSQVDAKFTILNLGGNMLPILANPASLDALPGGAWDQRTASVRNVTLRKNMTYTEQAHQPVPTVAELQAAPDFARTGDNSVDSRLFDLPDDMRKAVTKLAQQLTADKTNAYDKARAISDYFTNGQNGFQYSLSAPASNGSNQLVNFLQRKTGYCQQYAAAAAALMRTAGLPTRVVLGYSHPAPDNAQTITITTADAHAWVEVYFTGVGWIPFDPTPLAGADANRAVGLNWDRHPVTGDGPGSILGLPAAPVPSQSGRGLENPDLGPEVPAPVATSAGYSTQRNLLIVVGVLVLIALLVAGPQFLRRTQRRRRLRRAASSGDPEPLWQELAASAVDRDALWPATTTVGQVPAWLAAQGLDDRGLSTVSAVAERVQRARYSAAEAQPIPPELTASLDEAIRRWGRRAERRQRIKAWLAPRSLSRPANWRR
ncbi:MAG: hypothetical protein JWN95_3057 [Frankiales bacterium]|nr:hypothetical protein [Frankiales bacterium]